MAAEETSYDVAIVGGGPVGLTLALALDHSMAGLRIAVLDRRDFSVPRDQRASALSAGARRLLEAIGVWGGLVEAASPIRRMRITDSGTGDIARPLFLSFEGDVAPGEPFAHMVPNTALASVLLDAASGRIDLVAPVSVNGFNAGEGGARLALEGRTIRAPLIVAADGAMSSLRSMAGIGVFTHDYQQSGLAAAIGHERDHEGTAYEHFRPAGPFASLPLASGRRSSIVWTESPQSAARYSAGSPQDVALVIEQVMGSSLGAVTLESPLQIFPLSLRLARSFVAPRLALVGDAAHVVHPVAGQGLNLGLKDVAALTEVVIEAMRLGLDAGAPDVLGRYQRWRRLDTALMAAVTDGMNRLFSNDVAPVRALRDLGLGVVDRFAPLKRALIASAAGVQRDGPRLMRGLPV